MRGGINLKEHGAPQQTEFYLVDGSCQALIVRCSKIVSRTQFDQFIWPTLCSTHSTASLQQIGIQGGLSMSVYQSPSVVIIPLF